MKISNLASRLFFGATFLISSEVTGHVAFNTFGASYNLACLIDPTCRALSDSEIKLAEPFFGASIDYDKVRFYDRNWILKGIFNTDGKMSSQFGAIYNSSPYKDEHTTKHDRQAVFLHEMMHVWQFQNLNIGTLRNAFFNTWEYDYDIDPPLDLASYGVEQQAQMIEDLYNALASHVSIEDTAIRDEFYIEHIQPLERTILSTTRKPAPY